MQYIYLLLYIFTVNKREIDRERSEQFSSIHSLKWFPRGNWHLFGNQPNKAQQLFISLSFFSLPLWSLIGKPRERGEKAVCVWLCNELYQRYYRKTRKLWHKQSVNINKSVEWVDGCNIRKKSPNTNESPMLFILSLHCVRLFAFVWKTSRSGDFNLKYLRSTTRSPSFSPALSLSLSGLGWFNKTKWH